jgi:beta-glucosidase
MKAIEQKLLTEKEVDSALAGLLRTQFKLGFYDAATANPFYNYGADSVANAGHASLARTMAQQSMVLLKNNNQLLPIDKKKYSAIMVLGSNSASMDALLGNYHGVSNRAVSFLEGITNAVDAGTRVEYDLGSDYTDTVHFGGIWAAGNADITVAVIGLTPVYEGEEGDAFLAAKGGDKPDMSLPAAHIAFMKALRKDNKKPIIAVITAGSAVDISAIEPYADAIILAWYPGEQGGNALADILFGRVSPAGRLPVTFYQSFADVPAYDNYAMKGRTYRYFNGKVQYPFGYGLSYTSFSYEWQKVPGNIRTAKDSISFSIKVKNTGSMDGDEVVQVYVEYPPIDRMPLKELKAFKRVHVTAGGETEVQISIPAADLQKWDMATRSWKLYPGAYTIFAGGNSNDKKIVATLKTEVKSKK